MAMESSDLESLVIDRMRQLNRYGVEQFIVTDELYKRIGQLVSERNKAAIGMESDPDATLVFRGKKLLRVRDLVMKTSEIEACTDVNS